MKLTTRSTFHEFADVIGKREPFTTHGALTGRPVTVGTLIDTGRLPDEYRSAAHSRNVDYVVMSYGTPIAWHDTVTGWHNPTARYSVTTSRHQSKIGTAISVL